MNKAPIVELAPEVGERVADARRSAGLSQRELADRLGLRLWALDQIEQGASDPQKHIAEIARFTGKRPDWFATDQRIAGDTAEAPAAAAGRRTRLRSSLRAMRQASQAQQLVLGAITLLVLIRFFTEVVPVLPRPVNFIDIPILVALGLAAATRPRTDRHKSGVTSFALPAFAFLGLSVVSAVFNPSRVELGPVLVFIWGFLAPVGVYAAVYRLWPVGKSLSLSRLLFALGIVQLLVVLTIDLPRFLQGSHNPDLISGTFGTNAYQLVFFLLVFTALLAGLFTHEKTRFAARLAPLLFVLVLATIFLAQYRALLVSIGITIVFIGVMVGNRMRGVAAALLIAVSCGATLTYISSRYPVLKFAPTLSTFQETPSFYARERLKTATAVIDLYAENPTYIVTGTGPGTFSSRAFQTFTLAGSRSGSNVQGGTVAFLTGGRGYSTDVSDKYVQPQTTARSAIGGSQAVTSPYSSYLSLAAEVGLLGLVLMTMIYIQATARAIRMAATALRNPRPGDPLPALLLAGAVAFTLLVQMGFLENWLEVTRVTFISWTLLAVCTKEFAARANES